jgi:hypothetical protein
MREGAPRTATNSGKESVLAKAQPAAKFRLGYVTATVWLNDQHYNTVLSKSYKVLLNLGAAADVPGVHSAPTSPVR